MHRLGIEDKDTWRRNEDVIPVAILVLEIMLAVPLAAESLNLFARVALALRTDPPAESRNMAAEGPQHQHHASQEPGHRRQGTRRNPSREKRPSCKADNRGAHA
jgi:hypothetical protein